MNYGYFTDHDEFVVTRPDTPRAFDNFIWNDAMLACIHQTGVGYMDYQVGDLEAVKLLTGVGRICDFDVHGRDGLMSRLIFVRDNATGEFWTLNWEPVCRDYDHFACTHGPGYTILENTTAGIAGRFRIFAPAEPVPAECWTLTFGNATDEPRDLSIFVYNQIALKYKWGFDSYGDMIFRDATFSAELNAAIASKHPHHRPHNYLTGFLTADVPSSGYDGSRDAFVGLYNTLAAPKALLNGGCTNTPGSSDSTIAAMQFDISLAAGEKKDIHLILGATDSCDGIKAMREEFLGSMDEHFLQAKAARAQLLETNRLQTPDEHLNRLFNTWIKMETLYGATWCRWGWMGYRDIVQHGFGVVSFDAERTRRILLKALAHQYASGLAVRGWNPLDEKAYSDSALWLVFTLTAYVRETGDTALLDEVVPFLDDGSASVLEHVQRALDFLENNKGAHGICLIKFGDWNDSLTAIGAQGRGESVWLSMAYAEALCQMTELYRHLGRDDNADECTSRYEQMKSALNESSWDGRWYVRCFDDEGQPVGSASNEEGKMFLNAQSWAMIANIADPQRRQMLMDSCDEQLFTKIGYRLLAPTFTRPDDTIGRISYLEPGVCENGTVYSHVNAWMVLGLLRAGQKDKAYDTLRRVLPGYFNGSPEDPKRKCPPFVVPNGYFGPAHRNNAYQMEFTWATGSVAWLYNLILRDMVGVDTDYNGLRIKPNLPADWPEVKLSRDFRGKRFDITIHNKNNGEMKVLLNGKLLESGDVPLEQCEDANVLEVTC